MSGSSSLTYTRIGAILREIGMVSMEEARSVLDGVAHYANDELDQYHAACALESFGVAVSVHADDIDSIHYGYESLLVRAAKIAGGKVSITTASSCP